MGEDSPAPKAHAGVGFLSAVLLFSQVSPARAVDSLPEFNIRVRGDVYANEGPSVMYDEKLRSSDEDERSVQVRLLSSRVHSALQIG